MAGRRDPLRRLERGGGAVWAWKGNAPYHRLELRYAGDEAGHPKIIAEILSEAFTGDRPIPVDELNRLGWKGRGYGRKREWVLRSDLDREDLKRTVDATFEALDPDAAASYRLQYRPPGEEDKGYAEFGCLFALPSAIVGDVLGFVITFIRNEPTASPLTIAIFSFSLGFIGGFLGFGPLLPRIVGLVPSWRARASEMSLPLLLPVPGLIALAVWLLAPAFPKVDPGLLLIASVVLLVGIGFLLPMLSMVRVMLRPPVAGIKSASRAASDQRPPTVPVRYSKPPGESDLDVLIDALRQLCEAPDRVEFVIWAGSRGYVQFMPALPGLHGEAVSDAFLPEGARLSSAERAALEALGWQLLDAPNYSMVWPEPVDLGLVSRVAADTLRTYGDDPAAARLEIGGAGNGS